MDNNIPGGISPSADVETVMWDPTANILVGVDNQGHNFVHLTLNSNGDNIPLGTFLPGTPGLPTSPAADFEGSAMGLSCPMCLIDLSANPGTCDPLNNQYAITGTLIFNYPPSTGTLTVSVSGGGSQVFNAPFTSPQPYAINGLTADGALHTVTAVFSAETACTNSTDYTAPVSCVATCNLTASASGTNVLCNGGADGTASASATGNTGAVTYLWSNGGTTASISSLTAGTYSVTITETPTCTAVASYTVTEPSAALDATCSKTDVTTNGGADGTASVSASGGTSPYTYLWNTGATTQSISGLVAGTYSVTVTDANGCTDECTTTVQEPGCNLTALGKRYKRTLRGGADGTASASATGNLGAVTYLWSNGATTQNVNSLTAGTYSVTITETPTCTAVASYTVTEPSAALDATCSKTDVTTNGGADGTASVSASGGTSPYTYLWNTGATTQSISGLVAGTYSVTVTDANGCTDECTTTVQEPGCNLTASASGTNVLCAAAQTAQPAQARQATWVQ
ncbi:MAG: SprB repeat-containing protein [Sphingobacteriales bacterium]|nr:SprB repeat-containing protein [Sphingobacteriales bacterium]